MNKFETLKALLQEIQNDVILKETLKQEFSFDYCGNVTDFYEGLSIEMSGSDLVDFLLEYFEKKEENMKKKAIAVPWSDLTDEQKDYLVEMHKS